ncbi:hypothetical protein DL96DRAFT_1580425 [Flagelloscypha sp. PMI_526]|nr:hypothetical protein DL96DRAFT_1580425 [Flagelloscypha sp. PMI_526]
MHPRSALALPPRSARPLNRLTQLREQSSSPVANSPAATNSDDDDDQSQNGGPNPNRRAAGSDDDNNNEHEPLCAIGRKRKRGKRSTCKLPCKLRKLIKRARNFPRSVNPFIDTELLIEAGLEELGRREDAEELLDSDTDEGYDEDMRDESCMDSDTKAFRRMWSSFKILLAVPGSTFKQVVDELRFNSMSGGQGDRGHLRHDILSYLPKDLLHGTLKPQISLFQRTKADRGFNHPQIARLLVPIKDLVVFDSNPNAYRMKVLQGHIKISEKDYLLFLYDEDEVDVDMWDKDPNVAANADYEKGLFKGYLLIRHLFTSRSSVVSSTAPRRTNTRKNNAEIHDLTEAGGRQIAYTAVMTWFTLSTLESWGTGDSHFDLGEFYYSIVNAFEYDTEDEWAQDVIKFITSQALTSVRSNHLSHASSAPASSDPHCSVSRNALARKARKLTRMGPTDTASR